MQCPNLFYKCFAGLSRRFGIRAVMKEGNSACWYHVTKKLFQSFPYIGDVVEAYRPWQFCYFVISVPPHTSAFFFCCCGFGTLQDEKKGIPTENKSNIFIYRNCTKSNGILNKTILEFWGLVDLCLQVRKWIFHCRLQSSVSLPAVIQINCLRVCDLSVATMIISLLWLTEGPVSWCPEINETQVDESKKQSSSRHTIHSSQIAMPSVLHLLCMEESRSLPSFNTTLAPPSEQLFFGRTETWSWGSTYFV